MKEFQLKCIYCDICKGMTVEIFMKLLSVSLTPEISISRSICWTGFEIFLQKFLKPQIHCNHCSAAAFQTSPFCPSQALIMPAETRKLLDVLENPEWLHAYIKVFGLHKNWMSGRYHLINSRCHTKHVTGVVANHNCILSSGKDGYVYMYSRDLFVHYKLVKLDTEILCLEIIEETLICFVDSNGTYRWVAPLIDSLISLKIANLKCWKLLYALKINFFFAFSKTA